MLRQRQVESNEQHTVELKGFESLQLGKVRVSRSLAGIAFVSATQSKGEMTESTSFMMDFSTQRAYLKSRSESVSQGMVREKSWGLCLIYAEIGRLTNSYLFAIFVLRWLNGLSKAFFPAV